MNWTVMQIVHNFFVFSSNVYSFCHVFRSKGANVVFVDISHVHSYLFIDFVSRISHK